MQSIYVKKVGDDETNWAAVESIGGLNHDTRRCAKMAHYVGDGYMGGCPCRWGAGGEGRVQPH